MSTKNSRTIQPRWLFWLSFWYLLIASLYIAMGMGIILSGPLLIHNRKTLYRSILRLHRRFLGRTPTHSAHKMILAAPSVFGLGLMPAGVVWIFVADTTRRTMPALIVSVAGFLVLILLMVFYDHQKAKPRINPLQ